MSSKKSCLIWEFWWIRSCRCFYDIGDWTAKTTPETNLFEEWNKRKGCPGKLGVSNLECRPSLNEKTPQEHFFNYKKNISGSFHVRCFIYYPSNIYLFKVNLRNISVWCKICSKLLLGTSERQHWRRSSVFILNNEHILHFFPVFLLLTSNK